MMDVAAFSGEGFDVKDWINGMFRHPDAVANKERFASSLVMKFQLLIAKMNSNLESDFSHVLTAKQLSHDVDVLEQETDRLRVKMSNLKLELDDKDTSLSTLIGTLVKMDRFKARISATRKALKEADNWTTITSEIEDDIDSGDLDVVSSKLLAIHSSLKILTHVPDFEDRVAHIQDLRNRLEALSSPGLMAAFNENDLEKAMYFRGIFTAMERAAHFRKYYRSCGRARLLKAWTDIFSSQQQEGILMLQKWFQTVFKFVTEQAVWFKQVFEGESVSDNLMEILVGVYENMDPKLRVDATSGIDHLLQQKLLFNRHLEGLNDFFGDEGNMVCGQMRKLAKLLFQPFISHVANYVDMEGKLLSTELSKDRQTSSKDLADELRNVATSVPRFISMLVDVSKRCLELTEGCVYPALITSTFEDGTRLYMERCIALTRRLDKRKSASHSWLILQQSLTLNQICGDLLLQMEELDVTLANEFLERTRPFLGVAGRQDVIRQHDLYLLNSTLSRNELKEFHKSVGRHKGDEYPIVGRMLSVVRKACEEIQHSTFSILFHPIQEQISVVSNPATIDNVWKCLWAGSDSRQEDMPVYGFVPQEYMTQIGQYIMTLPQHLEPYMSHDIPSLARALQERVFPHCSGIISTTTGSQKGQDNHHQADTPADFLLSCVVRATCQMYQEAILKIPQVTQNSTKQLYVDIGYLGDILEDLGHPLTKGLSSVIFLLKLSPQVYWSSSSEHPQKLVSTIRKMRNLRIS